MNNPKTELNKAKLNNLIKRIEKEYDCEYSKRILDVVKKCYNEECDKVSQQLSVKKGSYLRRYKYKRVVCQCKKEMNRANIYNHQKNSCLLRSLTNKIEYFPIEEEEED